MFIVDKIQPFLNVISLEMDNEKIRQVEHTVELPNGKKVKFTIRVLKR